MPGSIPASATAEPAVGRPLPRRPWRAEAVLRSGAGVASLAATLALVAVALLADVLAPADPFAPIGPPLAAPSAAHPMGTDGLGRDLLSGVIYGTRTSLVVALSVGALTLGIGALVGTIAGFLGGVVDTALMRLTELFQVLPRFFLAVVVLGIFGPGLDRLVLVLGVTSWPILARVLRAEVLSLRGSELVDASRAIGASAPRIVRRHLLPNVLPAGIVYLGLVVAQVILLEASLGFLGLGDPNAISWGYLAGQAQRFLRVAWWLSFFPGAAIVVAVLAFNLLGDAFNEALTGRR